MNQHREPISLPASQWLPIRDAINQQRIGQTDDLLGNAVDAIDGGTIRGSQITVWGKPDSWAAVVNRCADNWPAKVFRPLVAALTAIEARRSNEFKARQEQAAEASAAADRAQPEPEPKPAAEPKPMQATLF